MLYFVSKFLFSELSLHRCHLRNDVYHRRAHQIESTNPRGSVDCNPSKRSPRAVGSPPSSWSVKVLAQERKSRFHGGYKGKVSFSNGKIYNEAIEIEECAAVYSI